MGPLRPQHFYPTLLLGVGPLDGVRPLAALLYSVLCSLIGEANCLSFLQTKADSIYL